MAFQFWEKGLSQQIIFKTQISQEKKQFIAQSLRKLANEYIFISQMTLIYTLYSTKAWSDQWLFMAFQIWKKGLSQQNILKHYFHEKTQPFAQSLRKLAAN